MSHTGGAVAPAQLVLGGGVITSKINKIWNICDVGLEGLPFEMMMVITHPIIL